MRLLTFVAWPLCAALLGCPRAVAEDPWTGPDALKLPEAGPAHLLILSPVLLELSIVAIKPPDPAKLGHWDYVDSTGHLQLPLPSNFVVRAGGKPVGVKAVGFKRRVVYAAQRHRDLRVGTWLYLFLTNPITDGQRVEVTGPDFPAGASTVVATMDPLRLSPAIHVNQVGYLPAFSKTAMVGYFVGSLGELEVPAVSGFKLVDARTGGVVHEGRLAPRRDVGYEYEPLPYQHVLVADFTPFNTPGEYRLMIPGFGASIPFLIDEGAAAAVARSYALGLYHQRCGTSNALPYTRFVHGPCHLAPVERPTDQFSNTVMFLAQDTADFTNNPRHVAHPLKNFSASLYPFVQSGKRDASGGHHDAGDYSKYTINSAALIHALVFAVDTLPGVAQLDNLGLPESGDGKSDLAQEAKWEADFLTKLQDDDGGFFFLVYPRDRRYENNVLPDQGDAQIVWPKNTAATAASVAALAQCASSPTFRKQFPESARTYLASARKGWSFLEQAMARHGRDGAYQKLTHYGDDFMHDDEIAWAACELFLATGDASFHKKLVTAFNPADPATRRWGWWRMYESYGRAIRSYVGSIAAGKATREKLDANFLGRCEIELVAGAQDQSRWAQQNAYGTSFPTETKRFRSGGWYFSMDQAFDLAAAWAVDANATGPLRKEALQAILSNLNYMAGCNPVNVCYLTGLGWRRPHEIVHHYAMNDRRSLPPSGLPVGELQAGFMWLDLYKSELSAMSFPSDGAENGPYPLYDRWSDVFNVQTEFVVVNQARALATAAFLMAQTTLKDQAWKPVNATIEVVPASGVGSGQKAMARLKTAQRDLKLARIVWEADGQQPVLGPTYSWGGQTPPKWIEAEVQWPDGLRAFATTNLSLPRRPVGGE